MFSFPTFVLLMGLSHTSHALNLRQFLPESIIPVEDYGILTPDLVVRRGYDYERHQVPVSDGFIITVHHIIHPKLNSTRGTVLMFHGVIGSTENFLNCGPDGFADESLDHYSCNTGFELVKRGYDVWSIDQRGTKLGSNHTFFGQNDPEFWDWSLDEIALLDLPAVIDYVTDYTKRPQIGYLAHSQGTLVMFMLLSRVPKYNDVIRPFVALAPVFYLQNVILRRAPLLRILPYPEVANVLKYLNLPVLDSRLRTFFGLACKTYLIKEVFCEPSGYFLGSLLSPFVFPDPPDIDYNRVAVHLSAGLAFTVSSKQFAQYLQMAQTNPHSLDISAKRNRQRYGTAVAPAYDPTRITCDSMAFISSVNDVLSDPTDMESLRQVLRVKPFVDEVITDRNFGHATFITGNRETTVKHVVKPVLQILGSFF